MALNVLFESSHTQPAHEPRREGNNKADDQHQDLCLQAADRQG